MIGPHEGESVPIENRVDGSNLPSNKSKIRWGDATVYLGYYIAVLASEYKLLTDAQEFEEAKRTKNELYYAITGVLTF